MASGRWRTPQGKANLAIEGDTSRRESGDSQACGAATAHPSGGAAEARRAGESCAHPHAIRKDSRSPAYGAVQTWFKNSWCCASNSLARFSSACVGGGCGSATPS